MASPTGQLPTGLPGTGDLLWTGSFISTRPAQDFIAFDSVSRDWWIAQGGKANWTKVGNTVGFGYAPLGCAVWIGDFAGTGHSQVLFYYPGDHNWWLGQFTGTQLTWSLAGNTAGFGQVWDGRPFWTGDFTGSGKADMLFYYPGDHNWWLGQFTGTQLTWSLAGNTAGFGQVWDGRPFWTGDFTGSGKTDVMFFYPGDNNWWLAVYTGSQFQWSLRGNGIPRVLELSMQSQQQTEWCWSATSVSVSHFYDSGSTWTQCLLVNNALGQTTCCNNGGTSQCNQPWYIDRALQIVKNFVSSGSAVTPTDVDSQVNNGRPLEVGIAWSGGGGHAVVIDGYQGTGTGELLSIRDPAYGDSWVSYSTFKSSYQGSGSWDQTCYTQS
jgi:Papain-like cysteine protease AvrRpt2